MMNGDLNPASPLQSSKVGNDIIFMFCSGYFTTENSDFQDGTVQFVENLYSRLNATSTTPLLKTKTRPKTNTRWLCFDLFFNY